MPDDADTTIHYDQDYYLWALDQARALRSARDTIADLRPNDWRDKIADLDWENLAEEIESLGRRDRRELGSRIETIIEHLTKLERSSATVPRAGWQETVDRSRDEIETILRDSPSLRQAVPALVEEMNERGRRLASRSLARYGEAAERRVSANDYSTYTPDQILTDWWPDNPHFGRQSDTPREKDPNP